MKFTFYLFYQIILPIILLYFQCSSKETNYNFNNNPLTKIVLVNFPIDSILNYKGIRVKNAHNLVWYDKTGLYYYKNLNNNDTVFIETSDTSKYNALIEIRVYSILPEYISFIINTGSTNIITYNSDGIFNNVNGKNNISFNNNYEYLKINKYPQYKFSCFSKLSIASFLNDVTFPPSKLKFEMAEASHYNKYYECLKNELLIENNFLDSLFFSHTIDSQSFHLFKNNIKHKLFIQKTRYLKFNQNEFNELKNKLESSDSFWDNALSYEYFVNSINLKTKKYNAIGSGGEIIPYIDIFDSINSKIIYPKIKKLYFNICLYKFLENSKQNIGFDNFEEVINKYIKYTHDSTSLNHFMNLSKYNTSDTAKTLLINSNMDTLDLDSVLKNMNGNLIYLDLWASWCIPCRIAMPYSVRLSKKYKEIDFIYLAINDNKEKWLKASSKEGINNHLNNYFVLNSNSSSLIKKYNIESIPRYFILNKNKNVILNNAPGPNNPKLESIFANYLK